MNLFQLELFMMFTQFIIQNPLEKPILSDIIEVYLKVFHRLNYEVLVQIIPSTLLK